MSAEIINLRQARKRKVKAEKEAASETNRARFGRTKAEKELSQARKARMAKSLDQSRRDMGETD